MNIKDIGGGMDGDFASSLEFRSLGLASRKSAFWTVDSVTCRDVPVQARHLHQTRARGRCGKYGVHRKGDACLGRYYCYRLWFVSSCTHGRSRISRANRCFLQAAMLLNAVKRRGIASKKNGSCESCSVGMAWVDCSCHHRTPMGGRGPRLLLELWAEGSESRGTEWLLSPLFALALAEPVRLRT